MIRMQLEGIFFSHSLNSKWLNSEFLQDCFVRQSSCKCCCGICVQFQIKLMLGKVGEWCRVRKKEGREGERSRWINEHKYASVPLFVGEKCVFLLPDGPEQLRESNWLCCCISVIVLSDSAEFPLKGFRLAERICLSSLCTGKSKAFLLFTLPCSIHQLKDLNDRWVLLLSSLHLSFIVKGLYNKYLYFMFSVCTSTFKNI